MIAPIQDTPESPDSPGSSSHRASLRSNIAWTFLGNVVYAACQWAILVVLARLGTKAVVGEFALAMAVSAPIIMLASLQLRWVQATDSRGECDIRDCIMLRLLCLALALPIILAVCWMSSYSRETTLIVTAVAIAKSLEAVCDVLYGWYQQHERMELISRSLMIRGPATVATVALAYWWTNDLLCTCLVMATTWAAILITLDIPRSIWFSRNVVRQPLAPRWDATRMWRLFVRALPVGLTAGVVALQINIPRYFVEQHLGKDSLGVFAAMAYLLLAAETFVRAVNQSAMPRMSQFAAEHNWSGFRSVVKRLTQLGSLCGLTAMLFAVFAGQLFLKIVYGSEYSEQPHVLTLMIVSSAVAFLLRPTEVALRSVRQFWTLLTVHALGLPVFVIFCVRLIPEYGLWGAAWAMLAQASWHGLATALLYQIWNQSPVSPDVSIEHTSAVTDSDESFVPEPLKGPHFLRNENTSSRRNPDQQSR